MSEPDKIHQQPAGIPYDTTEPRNWLILLVGLGIALTMVVIYFGVDWYYTYIKEKETYEKVLAPTSEILKQVRNRDNWNLSTYQYLDKNKTQVRIPIDRAMELIVAETRAGKIAWPTRPYPPKPEQPVGGPAQQAAPAPPTK
jgi:hypothetical protein